MKPKYQNTLSRPKREGKAHFPQSNEPTKLQFQVTYRKPNRRVGRESRRRQSNLPPSPPPGSGRLPFRAGEGRRPGSRWHGSVANLLLIGVSAIAGQPLPDWSPLLDTQGAKGRIVADCYLLDQGKGLKSWVSFLRVQFSRCKILITDSFLFNL